MNTGTTKKATDQLIAHVKQVQDGQWQIQSLMSHLLCTAELASKFSSIFGLEKVSYITGIVHDIGKASIDFQKKIKGSSGYDIEAHIEGYGNNHVDHSTAGAQLLVERYGEQIGTLLAFIVAGHHGGLPDGINQYHSCLKKRLNKDIPDYKEFEPFVRQYLNTIEPSDFKTKKSDRNTHNDWFSLQFIIRMLFSSLTDADFLDTEWFMDSQNASLRQIDITMDSIGEVYDKYSEDLISNPVGMINKKRSEILIACKNAAIQDPGIFSLTVPTGDGKFENAKRRCSLNRTMVKRKDTSETIIGLVLLLKLEKIRAKALFVCYWWCLIWGRLIDGWNNLINWWKNPESEKRAFLPAEGV